MRSITSLFLMFVGGYLLWQYLAPMAPAGLTVENVVASAKSINVAATVQSAVNTVKNLLGNTASL